MSAVRLSVLEIENKFHALLENHGIFFSASKLYNNITCENELRPYPKVPPIVTAPGTIYDVKTLDVFKTIGDAFLDVITRKTLFGNYLNWS